MYVFVLHQFSIGGLGARGAGLLGGSGACGGVGATWLVGGGALGWLAGATVVASETGGAEAEGPASTTTSTISLTTAGYLWILMALTRSRAAVMQTLDLGKTIRIAPNKVSRARRAAKTMAVSFSHSKPCSPLKGHCCCC